MRVRLLVLASLCLACGSVQKKDPKGSTLEGSDESGAQKITIVQYEQKTAELLKTSRALNDVRGKADEQKRRLRVICADYPDHDVCAPQTAAAYARKAFCEEPEFTKHVDAVVKACHEGECKLLDTAEQISRSDYMLLTQRLPHSLVTFNPNSRRLDRRDKAQLQRFLETLTGEKGYVIIVGRASKDGLWKKNIRLALDRAENTRRYLVESLGMNQRQVGYITYGHEKMYLTQLDAERLAGGKRMSVKQANRSALVFSYPCFDANRDPLY